MPGKILLIAVFVAASFRRSESTFSEENFYHDNQVMTFGVTLQNTYIVPLLLIKDNNPMKTDNVRTYFNQNFQIVIVVHHDKNQCPITDDYLNNDATNRIYPALFMLRDGLLVMDGNVPAKVTNFSNENLISLTEKAKDVFTDAITNIAVEIAERQKQKATEIQQRVYRLLKSTGPELGLGVGVKSSLSQKSSVLGGSESISTIENCYHDNQVMTLGENLQNTYIVPLLLIKDDNPMKTDNVGTYFKQNFQIVIVVHHDKNQCPITDDYLNNDDTKRIYPALFMLRDGLLVMDGNVPAKVTDFSDANFIALKVKAENFVTEAITNIAVEIAQRQIRNAEEIQKKVHTLLASTGPELGLGVGTLRLSYSASSHAQAQFWTCTRK